jgi:hypothetical protein
LPLTKGLYALTANVHNATYGNVDFPSKYLEEEQIKARYKKNLISNTLILDNASTAKEEPPPDDDEERPP